MDGRAFVPILPRPTDARGSTSSFHLPPDGVLSRPVQKKKRPAMELPKGTVVMEKSCLRCRIRKGELRGRCGCSCGEVPEETTERVGAARALCEGSQVLRRWLSPYLGAGERAAEVTGDEVGIAR